MDEKSLNKIFRIAAKFVSIYGDEHLPVFMRLANEIKIQEENMKLKQLANSVFEEDGLK